MSTVRQTWTWRLLDHDGRLAAEATPGAASRFDAEAWLGAHWRRLEGEGVAQAVLLRDGDAVGVAVDLKPFGR
jgi:hypothetical protein